MKIMTGTAFIDGREVDVVSKSEYDTVCFLLRHAHDALDYHYYPVLRGLIRNALGESVNEHGQLTRDSLDKLENSPPDFEEQVNG